QVRRADDVERVVRGDAGQAQERDGVVAGPAVEEVERAVVRVGGRPAGHRQRAEGERAAGGVGGQVDDRAGPGRGAVVERQVGGQAGAVGQVGGGVVHVERPPLADRDRAQVRKGAVAAERDRAAGGGEGQGAGQVAARGDGQRAGAGLGQGGGAIQGAA